MRAHKRRRLEDLADGLEQGVSCNQVRTTKVMVERLAPVPMPPRVPVRQKAGSPTWDHDGEIDARTDALVNIFGAEPLLFDTESQIQPSEALDSFAAGGPADKGRNGGAVAELWKAAVGQRAHAPLSACAQSALFRKMITEMRVADLIVFRKKNRNIRHLMRVYCFGID